MATIEQVYSDWRNSLKSPDGAIFYYHPSLDRIILGLAIYVVGSRSLINGLGKAEPLKVMNIYATDLIIAWIDENEEAFEIMFPMTVQLADTFMRGVLAYESKYPVKKKMLRKLATFFGCAVGAGGDMDAGLAEALLDDLSTDGKRIYSKEIQEYASNLLRMENPFNL